ncbi:hypothetical protein [Clostridium vincentii]|uniref:Uncharacterized protein n=1 Tax=Clostridium vincentii TaxID=52704 RepID=A0A2T0BGW4_9CLOT|nr:hypothetical protein [Clostridium vincentii]PRR83105.1 hypothetical protein CLVI_11400 [Clostridium vincentii]
MSDKNSGTSNKGGNRVGGSPEIRTGNGIGRNPPPTSAKPGIPGGK